MASNAGHPLLVIERLLRDRASVWAQIVDCRPMVTFPITVASGWT